jgi:hypothetical protein
MDEREFEERLGARLHRRFDRAEPTEALSGRVLDAIRAEPGPTRTLRSIRPLAAAAVIVVAVVAVALRYGIPGPVASPSPVPSLSPATAVPGTTIVYQVQPADEMMPGAAGLEATRRVLEKRLSATGAVGFSVQVRGTDEIVVDLPGIQDAADFRKLLGQTGNLRFVPLPPETYGTLSSPGPQVVVVGKPLPVDEVPLFGGESISQAYPTTGSADTTTSADLHALGFRLDSKAATTFADYTSKSIGQFFAIVLDNVVITAPNIQSPITGGEGVISFGDGFTSVEVNRLVTILTYGPLPFPLKEAPSTAPTATAPSTGSPTTPAPSASTTGDTSGGFTWQLVPSAQFGGTELDRIEVLPDGLLAIGGPWGGPAVPSGSTPRPTLWRSTDGLAWRRLADSPAFAGTGGPYGWFDSIAGVAPGRTGLVAVGATNEGDMSAFDAEAWTSPDGVSWQRAVVSGAKDAAMNDVAPGPGGFVAVGIDGHTSGGTQMVGSRGAAVWTSADGKRWTRLPTEADFAGAEMTRVIAGPSGYLAVGRDMPAASVRQSTWPGPPIWISADGTHWERVVADIGAPRTGGDVTGLAWTGHEYVMAVGCCSGFNGIATSPDGRSWTAAELQAPAPGGAIFTIADLEAGGSPFVAVGWLGVAPDSARAVVWESAGGSRWESVPSLPLFENAAPVGVVRTGSGTLVVLSRERAPDANATHLWLATPASSRVAP